jgi:hypothetical protein
MLLDRIKKMRKKSYAERQRTTLILSVCTTAVIAFVWGTLILPQTLTINETEVSRAETATPLKTLSEDAGIIFGDIRKGINHLGSVIGEAFSGEDEFVIESEEEINTFGGSRGEVLFIEEESSSSTIGETNEGTAEGVQISDDEVMENTTESSQD